MAAIGKIRQNSGLLLIVIGGAMVAFVLSDMFSSGGRVQEQYVGEIAGNSIDRLEYERRVQKQLESRNSVGQATSAQMTESIRNTVWNNMVREMVMFPEMREAGIAVTPDEFDDLTLGENILPEFKNDPTFQNQETGQFDKELVKQYLEFVQSTPQYQTYWELQKQRIVNQRMYEKYNEMVAGGLMANALEAKHEYQDQNRKADLRYVVQTYAALADTVVSYDDSDLRAYYNEHKEEDRFQQNATRSFDYVVFEVSPTVEDSVAIQKYLEEMKPDFERTTRDSVFIVNNSDTRSYSIINFKPGTVQTPEVDEMIMSADSGTVVGPYMERSFYVITKVLDVVKEEQARVRHILLATDGKDKEEVRQRADSLLRVVKTQNNFEEMVTQFSEDPGSVQNGGVYEWFNRERMVPEFTAASFDQSVGDITIAETQYGFHIVEVLGQREQDQRNIVRVTRNIEPSTETFEEVYQAANGFSLNFDSPELFPQGAEEEGYEIEKATDIARNNSAVGGIQDATELIRWAFSAEEGTVSEPIEIDTKIIVALLTKMKEEGTAPFEDVRETIEIEVVKDKKAVMLTEKMQGHSSIEEVAEALGVSVRPANGINFANPTLGGTEEPDVVGKAMTLEAGQMSTPLKGVNGVYVVQIENIVAPMEVENYQSERQSIEARMTSRAQGGVFQALKEKAEVKDERAKYY